MATGELVMRGQKSTPTRRALLGTIGTGVAAGLLGTDATATRGRQSEYALEQGDECVPIRPISLERPVDAFYDYQLPQEYVSETNGASVGDTARYASAGTTDLQREQTSLVFLYRGPEGVSLVVVHGSVQGSDAGAVTFRLSGLPADGSWVVKDDFYRDPDTGDLAASNYDRWRVEGTDHRIDWTWGDAGTDGGAFRDLGDAFAVTVDPAFNEAAALYDEHYEGTVTEWEFLSASEDAVERISLRMDEPIRLATGHCERGGDDDEDEQGGDEEEDDGTYTVCHEPPGNPNNARTIQVGNESALQSHLDHGDSRGPCSEDE